MIQQSGGIFEQIQAPLMKPIHPRGVVWVGGAALLTIIGMLAGWGITGLLLFITGIFYVCFRDPQRVMPIADGIATAPADGILTRIDRAVWPAEVGMDGDAARLIITPRFYDAHVLRAPAPAALTSTQHITGQWGSNLFDKDSSGNERVLYIFKLSDNRTIALEVIAGGMAERIRPSARAGDVLSLGQAIGYAAFGGEVRLYLPDGAEIIAQPGQRMIAGETAIAALEIALHQPYDDVVSDIGVLPNSAGFRF